MGLSLDHRLAANRANRLQCGAPFGVVDVTNGDLCAQHVSWADRCHEFHRLPEIDRAMTRQLFPDQRLKSRPPTSCHVRCGPRRWCPGRSPRPCEPGFYRSILRQKVRCPGRLPVSRQSATCRSQGLPMTIVPVWMLSSIVASAKRVTRPADSQFSALPQWACAIIQKKNPFPEE